MTLPGADIVVGTLAVAAVISAVLVVVVREAMRMALSLGVFLLSSAGLFLYYGAPFLAAAQVFVYVGGVLVLVVLAIMVIRRSPDGSPVLASRHDPVSAAMCAMFAAGASWLLLRDAPPRGPMSGTSGSADLASAFLGPMVVHMELLGALLLVALVAVVAISEGERR